MPTPGRCHHVNMTNEEFVAWVTNPIPLAEQLARELHEARHVNAMLDTELDDLITAGAHTKAAADAVIDEVCARLLTRQATTRAANTTQRQPTPTTTQMIRTLAS